MSGTDDTSSRRARGISSFTQILAVPEPLVPAALADRVGEPFAQETLQSRGGTASSPKLTDREQSVAVLTALTAQGIGGDRLTTHTCGWPGSKGSTTRPSPAS